MMSDFRPEVEIQPFRACAMHPAIIIGTVRSLWTWLWGRYRVPQNVFLVFVINTNRLPQNLVQIQSGTNTYHGQFCKYSVQGRFLTKTHRVLELRPHMSAQLWCQVKRMGSGHVQFIENILGVLTLSFQIWRVTQIKFIKIRQSLSLTTCLLDCSYKLLRFKTRAP